MCGIGVILRHPPNHIISSFQKFLRDKTGNDLTSLQDVSTSWDEHAYVAMLRRRGPSFNDGEKEIVCSNDVKLTLYGAVLHLRGDHGVAQPCGWPPEAPKLWVLWNGEVFGGLSAVKEVAGCSISDTRVIAEGLYAVFDQYARGVLPTLDAFQASCLSFLENIQGPFSIIVYFDSPVSQLWIGRDKIGRRSLCLSFQSTNKLIAIGSVGCPTVSDGFNKLTTASYPVGGMVLLSLASGIPLAKTFQYLPWMTPPAYETQTFLSQLCASPRRSVNEVVSQLHVVLTEAVVKRIQKTSRDSSFAILFSGGLDSGLLAALALQHLPPSQPLELINVVFGSSSLDTPDRYTAMATYLELAGLFQNHSIKLICSTISYDTLMRHEVPILHHISPNQTHMDFNIGAPLYFASRARGFHLRPTFSSENNAKWWNHFSQKKQPANCYTVKIPRAKFAVSNDQGLTLCTRCKCKRAKPQCVNSACRTCCKRLMKLPSNNSSGHDAFTLTTLESCSSLRCSAHRCEQNCVTQSASTDDPCFPPPQCVYSLAPSVMNKEACCDVCTPPHNVPVHTLSAPILLVGHGADELFAGYGRYATAGRHGGPESVRTELIKDLQRLWERNLGRDDRCISCWGREARHPFLDENVIAFLAECPVDCLFSDVEDKTLLRQLARRLGLSRCSKFKKRAIQFGSRSARQTNLQHFESHRKANGVTLYAPQQQV